MAQHGRDQLPGRPGCIAPGRGDGRRTEIRLFRINFQPATLGRDFFQAQQAGRRDEIEFIGVAHADAALERVLELAEKIGAGDLHFIAHTFHRRVRPGAERKCVQALRLAGVAARPYAQFAQEEPAVFAPVQHPLDHVQKNERGHSRDYDIVIEMPDPILLVAVFIIAVYLFSAIKILNEYERGVVFRLGRVLGKPKGPGLILVFAPIDRFQRISLRVEAMEVPPQDVVTKDNVTVKVNAVVYFRVVDPTRAVIEVTNFLYATSQVSQTTLRSVLGEVELDELLSQREKLNLRLQGVLDQHTDPWGVKVTMVEVKQVDLPESMIRAIARQAEAERERRAKIIHAQGEFEAAQKLAQAAEVIQQQPAAIQLRYLQTLVEIGSEKNTTVVFPLPLDIFSSLTRALDRFGGKKVE